ncbi:MAG: fatty acyl-AMP ligase [Mycobacterium sp.]
MSSFTREIIAAAASSPHGLTVGTIDDPVRHSWKTIHHQAVRMAGGLAGMGVGAGQSVTVLAADAADVAALSQAVWLRGAAVTMLQQPTRRTDLAVWLDDTVRAIRMIGAELVVLGDAFLSARAHLVERNVAVCSVDELRRSSVTTLEEPGEADVAMRQLTSGSTGTPKAVEITHANLAANVRGIREGLAIDADEDVTVSWLPLSHDMGMIGFLYVPMHAAMEAVVVTPEQFLRRPIVWAELISKHRATLTSGPNFAYSVLARVLDRSDEHDLDLSSLRVAGNGAEPIDHRDVEAFTAVASRFGLRASAPTPLYGLAEATLAVSVGALDQAPAIDRVSRRAVTEDRWAQPLSQDSPETQQHVVCVGLPVNGTEVRITRDAREVGVRQIGAIELRGPAIAENYLTVDGIRPLANHDGWFDTGDLGYCDERGGIYVCGRSKDLIVLAGKNLYPHDIERAAESVDGVRRGCVVAVRVDADREGFAVLAEVHDPEDDETRSRVSRDIALSVSSRVGHRPSTIRLFAAGTLPKTPSGKLRRSSARDLLSV